MSAAQQYLGAKHELAMCEHWASLLGQRYHGGGGGYGRLVYLDVSRATIYHQPRDGDTNYHDVPPELLPDLQDAIRARFPEILADALERKHKKLAAVAQEALLEHEELMRVANDGTECSNAQRPFSCYRTVCQLRKKCAKATGEQA